MVRGVTLVACAVAPAIVLVCVELGVLSWTAMGGQPRWPDEQLTLSEAAAVRDEAEVVRLVNGGQDPNARYRVRVGLVDNGREVQLTPLEAAVSIRRPEMVDLLFLHGVRASGDDWRRLRCVADAFGDRDLVAALERGSPGQPNGSCAGSEALW